MINLSLTRMFLLGPWSRGHGIYQDITRLFYTLKLLIHELALQLHKLMPIEWLSYKILLIIILRRVYIKFGIHEYGPHPSLDSSVRMQFYVGNKGIILTIHRQIATTSRVAIIRYMSPNHPAPGCCLACSWLDEVTWNQTASSKLNPLVMWNSSIVPGFLQGG